MNGLIPDAIINQLKSIPFIDKMENIVLHLKTNENVDFSYLCDVECPVELRIATNLHENILQAFVTCLEELQEIYETVEETEG